MKSEKVTDDLPDGHKWCVSCYKSTPKYIEFAQNNTHFQNMVENPVQKYFHQNPSKIPRNNVLSIIIAEFEGSTPSELGEIEQIRNFAKSRKYIDFLVFPL